MLMSDANDHVYTHHPVTSTVSIPSHHKLQSSSKPQTIIKSAFVTCKLSKSNWYFSISNILYGASNINIKLKNLIWISKYQMLANVGIDVSRLTFSNSKVSATLDNLTLIGPLLAKVRSIQSNIHASSDKHNLSFISILFVH